MKLSKDEIKWRAEEDARTLSRYQEIMSDAKRKAAAGKALNSQIKKAEAGLSNLRKAGGKLNSRKK